MVSSQIVRIGVGWAFILCGLVAGIACAAALASTGPLAIFGIIGSLCAITVGARWANVTGRADSQQD